MKKDEVVYGKTKEGQIVYDFTFVKLSDSYLARKHRISVAEVRRLRELPAVKSLAKQNGVYR